MPVVVVRPATVGLGPRLDVQLTLPWYTVQANRPDAELCGVLGLGACRTTSGLGILEARGKALLLDEFFGAPFSLAVGTELRAGQLTASTRERITNIGEGTTDTGVYATVGRTGGLGSGGSWAGYVEALGRYRFPTTRSYPSFSGDLHVPGPEVTGIAELLAGPTTRVAVGPTVSFFWRPGGLDWGEVDLTDVDRLGALRVMSLRAGGTVVVRGDGDVSASVSILRTAAAVNNPTDVLSVSAGLQVTTRIKKALDG